MPLVWVLVADNSQARLFTSGPRGTLDERRVFVRPESRAKRADIISDQAGRYFDGRGPRKSAMPAPTDPKLHEAERFANELVSMLEAGRSNNEFSKVYVVAPPTMLGLLRARYSAPLRRLIAGELDKNLVMLRTEAICEHLPELL